MTQTPAHPGGQARDAGPASYQNVIAAVTRAGITQAELADAVGSGTRAVQNWASGQNLPRGATVERLLDVHTVVRLLSDTYTDEGVNIWLHARNRNLEMRRPIDLIRGGAIDQVIDEANWVAGGM